MKTRARGAGFTLAVGITAMVLFAARAAAETAALPSIALPNPYAVGVRFGELPEGRQWGGVIAVTPDRDGKSIWAFERCGGNCLNSDLPPVLEFDPSGKLIKSFGAGMFVFPQVSPLTSRATSMSPMQTARTARATSWSSSAPTARC